MLGVLAVLAACAGRLVMVGGVDAVVLLLLVSLFSVAAGGVYQQKFCRGVDFRATAALQNAACVAPGGRARGADAVHRDTTRGRPRSQWPRSCCLNATLCMTMYVRAVNDYGAAAVAMLFAVIPAVAGLLSWLMLGERPDIGIAVGLGGRRGGVLAQRPGVTAAVCSSSTRTGGSGSDIFRVTTSSGVVISLTYSASSSNTWCGLDQSIGGFATRPPSS